jgi:hypothetical protein
MQEYTELFVQITRQQEQQAENASATDKLAGQEAFRDLVQNDARFADAVANVMGNYNAYMTWQIEDAISRTRMNHRAVIWNTIATHEATCSRYYATKVWHSLTSDEQQRINNTIERVIAEQEE